MKKLLFLFPLSLLLACGTGNEKVNNGLNGSDTVSALPDLNTYVSKTIFDSVPFEPLPYTDSICMETFKPLRNISLSAKTIEFLQIKNIRDFKEYDWQMPDSAFSIVCRLKLSKDFYSLIFNYDGENETMNYMINYDREYKVIDYIETSYDELVESVSRINSTIDTSGVNVMFSNFLDDGNNTQVYHYTLSSEGFFREQLAVIGQK